MSGQGAAPRTSQATWRQAIRIVQRYLGQLRRANQPQSWSGTVAVTAVECVILRLERGGKRGMK